MDQPLGPVGNMEGPLLTPTTFSWRREGFARTVGELWGDPLVTAPHLEVDLGKTLRTPPGFDRKKGERFLTF